MTTEEKAIDEKPNPMSKFKRIMLSLGVACCLQYFILGAVGVMRGYSIQSWAPIWICLAGIFLLIPFHSRFKWASFLTSVCLIVFGIVGTSQWKHRDKGEELYEAGDYEKAIIELRQELDTWYLRLEFNHHEAVSLFKIAECQSQLGRFEEALDSYREIEEKFRGHYHDRAHMTGKTVEDKLAEIVGFEKALNEATNDQARAMIHFDLALAYREVTCFSKAMEHYKMVQELDAPERLKKVADKYANQLRRGE